MGLFQRYATTLLCTTANHRVLYCSTNEARSTTIIALTYLFLVCLGIYCLFIARVPFFFSAPSLAPSPERQRDGGRKTRPSERKGICYMTTCNGYLATASGPVQKFGKSAINGYRYQGKEFTSFRAGTTCWGPETNFTSFFWYFRVPVIVGMNVDMNVDINVDVNLVYKGTCRCLSEVILSVQCQ